MLGGGGAVTVPAAGLRVRGSEGTHNSSHGRQGYPLFPAGEEGKARQIARPHTGERNRPHRLRLREPRRWRHRPRRARGEGAGPVAVGRAGELAPRPLAGVAFWREGAREAGGHVVARRGRCEDGGGGGGGDRLTRCRTKPHVAVFMPS